MALLQATLTGTEFIYQGQEIGMTNLPRSWDISEYLDINSVNYYRHFKEKYGKDADFKEKLNKLMDSINLFARDNARSPVQWTAGKEAGFTTGKPWTRVNDNYKEINVESQVNDKNSLFTFWKNILKIRKEYKDLFIYGSFKILDTENKQVFTFLKTDQNNKSAYVAINFSTEKAPFKKLVDGEFNLLYSNVPKAEAKEGILTPYEARVYLLS